MEETGHGADHRNLTRRRSRPDAVHARHLRDLRGRRRPRRPDQHHQRRRLGVHRGELPHQVRGHQRARPGSAGPCSRTTTPTGTSTTSCTTPTPTPQTPPTPRPAPTEVAERGRQGRPESASGEDDTNKGGHHATGPTNHPLPAHLGDPPDRGHGDRARPGPRRAPGPRHCQCPVGHRLGPPPQAELFTSLPALLGGDSRAGLTAAPAAPPALLYTCLAISEVLAIALLIWAARLTWRAWGSARVRGMATRAQAQAILGPSRLRRVAPVVRPDRYGNGRHR